MYRVEDCDIVMHFWDLIGDAVSKLKHPELRSQQTPNLICGAPAWSSSQRQQEGPRESYAIAPATLQPLLLHHLTRLLRRWRITACVPVE